MITPHETQLLKDEMRQDMMEEAYTESILYNNLDYCIEHHLRDIPLKLERLSNDLSKYGHELAVDELLDYLKGIL